MFGRSCVLPPLRARSVVRKKVLAEEERNCDWALTWWALADIPEPVTPKGEFRMSYSTKQAIYYGEVRDVPSGTVVYHSSSSTLQYEVYPPVASS